jgi:hypothetical protein
MVDVPQKLEIKDVAGSTVNPELCLVGLHKHGRHGVSKPSHDHPCPTLPELWLTGGIPESARPSHGKRAISEEVDGTRVKVTEQNGENGQRTLKFNVGDVTIKQGETTTSYDGSVKLHKDGEALAVKDGLHWNAATREGDLDLGNQSIHIASSPTGTDVTTRFGHSTVHQMDKRAYERALAQVQLSAPDTQVFTDGQRLTTVRNGTKVEQLCDKCSVPLGDKENLDVSQGRSTLTTATTKLSTNQDGAFTLADITDPNKRPILNYDPKANKIEFHNASATVTDQDGKTTITEPNGQITVISPKNEVTSSRGGKQLLSSDGKNISVGAQQYKVGQNGELSARDSSQYAGSSDWPALPGVSWPDPNPDSVNRATTVRNELTYYRGQLIMLTGQPGHDPSQFNWLQRKILGLEQELIAAQHA